MLAPFLYRLKKVAIVSSMGAVLFGICTGAAPVIEKVEVVGPPGVAVPRDLVLQNLANTQGAEFSPAKLREDVKRLYRTGLFSDVETEVIRHGADRVVLRVRVTPKPMVRDIRFEGNRVFKTRKLRKLIKHPVHAPLDEEQMAADAEAIRKRYRDSGYANTVVTAVVQPIPNTNQVNLIFRIKESKRFKIRHVRFEGNTLFSSRKLRKAIKSKRTFWSWLFRTGYFDEEQLRADIDRLRMLYTEKGYLDFEVTKVERIPSPSGARVDLVFHLREGRPYTVSKVTITGTKRFSEDELKQNLQLKPGMVYNSTAERKDVESIRARYEVLGYIDVACIPVHTLDAENHTAAIEYRVREGIPCRIQDIYIRGNQVTKDYVIRRELAVLPGDLADGSKIRASKSRLMNLNYFESVDIVPLTTPVEDQRDLLVTVKEKPTGQLQLGAGFSTEEAVVGSIEVSQSNFDWRNWPRFTGGGQRMRLRLQLGTERDDLLMAFTEPWLGGRRLRLDLSAFRHDRDQDQYDESRTGISGRLTRPIWPRWRGFVGLRVQQVQLDNFDDGVSRELLREEGSYTANVLSIGFVRDTRNRYINPSSGTRLSLVLDLEPELLGSYSNVYRLDAEFTHYKPLPKGAVLKTELEIGMVDEASGDPVAIFDRFFAGGAYSIRGFDRREVGPVDENEDPVGGKSLLRGAFELIFPIYERIMGSLFCDYGNVWRDSTGWDPTELNISIGIGFQLNLPIGPIRLDYGWPVVTEEDHLKDNGGRLHFNIGYVF